MKFSSFAVALAASLPLTSAVRNGFNMGANKKDGSCNTESDWYHAFKTMKHLPGKFDVVRLYASGDCGTLANAVPAAKKAGVKILVGVWAYPVSHFQTEKAALIQALQQYGTKWISAVSVGSEDLYRNQSSPGHLARQVNDIRGVVRSYKGGKGIPIGHVDTYTEWIKKNAAPLIHAVDFIGSDAYPYYQGKAVASAKRVFDLSLKKTKKHSHGKPIWITETGWPVAGPNDEKAISSVQNAQHYWQSVICGLLKTHNTFVYDLKDYWLPEQGIPSFGVVGKNNKPLYNLHCKK